MSSEAQVALIVGIIAAASGLIGALGGTALGWFLNRRNDRRTEKRAAFVELLSAIDGCQHACLRLASALNASDQEEILRQMERSLDALSRVDTAVSVTALTVGPEHMQTLRNGMVACIQELDNARKGTPYTTATAGAWNPILELARKELGR